jgi:hypothetical protein
LWYLFAWIESPLHTVANRRVASHIPHPKEFAQILSIFLPFPKINAVKSAPSEENG